MLSIKTKDDKRTERLGRIVVGLRNRLLCSSFQFAGNDNHATTQTQPGSVGG